MRNSIVFMAAALALAGCGDASQATEASIQTGRDQAAANSDPLEIKIADIDFFNMSETHEIASKLSPADAPLFLEYAINWKAAKVSGDESKILKPDGTAPVTIAEATALTKAVLAKNAKTGDR